jgi:hypothetical protein
LVAAAPKGRPVLFGRPWIALLVITDVCMFLIAAFAAIELVKGYYVPRPSDSIAVSTVLYAAFWLIIFERLGLYRRSFALSVKDEI